MVLLKIKNFINSDKVSKIADLLLSKYALLLLLLLSFSTIFIFHFHPTYFNSDVSLYAGPSYNFYNTGELLNAPCFLEYYEKTHWQPPLWFVLTGLTTSLFEFSFFSIHILPLVFYLLFLILAYYFIPKEHKIVGLCLILSLSAVNAAITNRPDTLFACLILIIIFSKNIPLISILAGIVLYTHTIGIIIFFYAFFKVLVRKNINEIILFCVIVSIVTLPLLIYILTDFTSYYEQVILNNWVFQGQLSMPGVTKYLDNIIYFAYLPLILIVLTKIKEIKLETAFLLFLLIFFTFFTFNLYRYFRYGIIITPFLLFLLDFKEDKRIFAFIILLNIILLSYNLVMSVSGLHGDSVNTCIDNFKEINKEKNICMTANSFIFQPDSEKCIFDDDCEYFMESESLLPYYNLTDKVEKITSICNITRNDGSLNYYVFKKIESNT
jgi:hypothetical protein